MLLMLNLGVLSPHLSANMVHLLFRPDILLSESIFYRMSIVLAEHRD